MDIVEEAVNSKLRNHLTNVVNLVCTVQILQIYIHDLSLLRVVLSLCLQYSVLSPQFDQIRVSAPPPNRRTVMFIITANYLVAVISHLFWTKPTPGFDGLLHGVIFVEFIGVRPVASLWLVVWDTMVFFFQFLEFAANFPIPSTSAEPEPTQESEPAEETSLLQQTAVSVAKVLSGTAIIYTWDLPRNIVYNWKFESPPQAQESESEQSSTASPVPPPSPTPATPHPLSPV